MPKPTDYDKTHLRNMAAIGTRIDRIFKKAAEEAAKIGVSIKAILPEDRIFSFDDYPETKKQINRLMTALQESMETTIVNGVRSEWTLSNNKNNALVSRIFGDNVGKLTKEQYKRYFSTNGDALEAFIKRKEHGLNLSDRVWKYTNAFKNEIELGLDLGIRTGESAASMTRSLRQYLQYPDKLFRRVRDKHGILRLSKAAQAFHPGRGVYRSSYKNARRLAATETNIAYRTSDHLRWQQLEFVVGIEIQLSNNHTINGMPLTDICNTLAGKYPKDFKFTGWHPLCRCHVLTVLKTEEEMEQDTQRILNGEQPLKGSVNTVKNVPANFRHWVEEHSKRIGIGGKLPYFIADNRKRVDGILGIATEPKKTPLEIAQERHEARTPEQANAIQQAWNESRIRSLEEYINNGLLPEDCKDTLKHLLSINSPEHFEEVKARIATLQKAANRHAARSEKTVNDIKERWAKKQKRDATTRLMANNVLKVAQDWQEVDFSILQKIISDNNLGAMRAEAKKMAQAIKAMRDEEKALSAIIPDVHDWHKKFSLAELKQAHKSVTDKLAKLESKGMSLDTDSNLAGLKKKLEFEMDYVENPGKYKPGAKPHNTWEVAQSAYKQQLAKVEARIEILKLNDEYEELLNFKTTSKIFNDYITKVKAKIDAGDAKNAKFYLDIAKNKKAGLEKNRTVKSAKKGSTKATESFDESCFTEQRKKNAYFAKSEDEAEYSWMFDEAKDAYSDATIGMKMAARAYTQASGSITKMLRQGLDGYYENELSYAIKSSKHIDDLTDFIGKNTFSKDVWLVRDERAVFTMLKTGGINPSILDEQMRDYEQKLKAKYKKKYRTITAKRAKEIDEKIARYKTWRESRLIGREGIDTSFLSCGSNKGHEFTGTGGDNKFGMPKVRLEIYCPKGTQGIYAAPYNVYNGAPKGSDGFWNASGHTIYISEAEVFLQRGTKFRITEARYDMDEDRWYIKCEVIGQKVQKISGYEKVPEGGYQTKFE